ncbi:MAG: hypothetical protein ACI37S_06070 [Candidatus Gastranaerophilaceae bacterium]
MTKVSVVGNEVLVTKDATKKVESVPMCPPILPKNTLKTDVFESSTKEEGKSFVEKLNEVLFKPIDLLGSKKTDKDTKPQKEPKNPNKEIAENVFKYLDKNIAAVGDKKFEEEFAKINTNNIVSVMKEYDKLSPKMSLIGAICDEKANFGNTRKKKVDRLVDYLVMAGNKVGVQTPHYSNIFDKELDKQFGKLTPIKVQQMDKISKALLQAIENKSSLTPEERLEIKNADIKTTQTYTTKALKDAAKRAEKSMEKQAEYDGWSAKLGEKIRKIWHSDNQKNLVQNDINKFKEQIEDLDKLIGKPEYNKKFYELFDVEYDPELIAKCQEKEEKYTLATLFSAVSETFNSSMEDVLQNKKLEDRINYPKMPKAQPILYETRQQRYNKAYEAFAEFVGQGDIGKGKAQLDKFFQEKKLDKNTSLDKKYELLRTLAVNYSKILEKNKENALNKKTLEEMKKEYENSYYAAFGVKNDIAKRVVDYRSSQMFSELLVQDTILCAASIPIFICSGGIGLVPALKIAGMQSAADFIVYASDRFSSKEGMTKEALKDTLKWMGIDSATAFANILSYKGIEAITSPIAKMSGTAAQITDFALCTAADLAVDCGFEYVASGKVTLQGVVYSLLFSSSGYIIDMKVSDMKEKKASKAATAVAGTVSEVVPENPSAEITKINNKNSKNEAKRLYEAGGETFNYVLSDYTSYMDKQALKQQKPSVLQPDVSSFVPDIKPEFEKYIQKQVPKKTPKPNVDTKTVTDILFDTITEISPEVLVCQEKKN